MTPREVLEKLRDAAGYIHRNSLAKRTPSLLKGSPIEKGEWDESKHPRDASGKFGDVSGEGSTAGRSFGSVNLKENPYKEKNYPNVKPGAMTRYSDPSGNHEVDIKAFTPAGEPTRYQVQAVSVGKVRDGKLDATGSYDEIYRSAPKSFTNENQLKSHLKETYGINHDVKLHGAKKAAAAGDLQKDFSEELHPRDESGRFSGGEGGTSAGGGKERSVRDHVKDLAAEHEKKGTTYGYFGHATKRNADHDEFVADSLEQENLTNEEVGKLLESSYGRHLADSIADYQKGEDGEYHEDDVQAMSERIHSNVRGWKKSVKEGYEKMQKDWDESKHPRDESGRFGEGGATERDTGYKEEHGKGPGGMPTVIRTMEAKEFKANHSNFILSDKDKAVLARAEKEGKDVKGTIGEAPFGRYLLSLEMTDSSTYTDRMRAGGKDEEDAEAEAQRESDARQHEPYSQDLKDDTDPEYDPDEEERDKYGEKVTKALKDSFHVLQDAAKMIKQLLTDSEGGLK